MKKYTQIPKNSTIFSHKAHLSSLKKTARIKFTKATTRKSLQLTIVTAVCLSLLSIASLPVLAGYSQHRPSYQSTINKRVHAKAGNNNHFGGGGRSHASVSNNNSVYISSGGGSGHRYVASGGHNNQKNNHRNNNNGNDKKVVKKKVVKKDIDVNNITINKSVTVDKPYDYCAYHDCNDQHYSKDTRYHQDNNYHQDYSYKKYNNPHASSHYNPCNGYHCYRDSTGRIIIINNNSNTNTNENYNRNENYNTNDSYSNQSSEHYKDYYYNGY